MKDVKIDGIEECVGLPRYREVTDKLRDDILSGKYMPGSAFPSVKMICRRFSVSHLTAVKAIEALKQVKLIKSRNGVGTFVARRMTSIGLVVPMQKQVEIFPPICQEISRLCMERGVAVDFADISSVSADKVHSVVIAMAERMVAAGVSGVVFHPIDFGDNALDANGEVLRIFSRASIPVIILDTDIVPMPEEDRFDFVGVDNFEIGQFAGRHVIAYGARKIVFVSRTKINDNVQRRLEGLLSAISMNRGAKLAGKYLSLDEKLLSEKWGRALPDAIVCASDFVAVHVLKILRKIGKRCPQDVLVTGVNDVDLATLVSPTLTTVHQPCKSIARTAFETLLWRIDNPDAEKRRIMIAAELVVRESTSR